MPLIGKAMPQEFSIIAVTHLIMLYLWSDQVTLLGQSRTHGLQPGENKDTFDWLKEILAEFALAHHSQFDKNDIYEQPSYLIALKVYL